MQTAMLLPSCTCFQALEWQAGWQAVANSEDRAEPVLVERKSVTAEADNPTN
jgi:hypothetical protein